MKTYTTWAVASWLLVAASGAMAAPSSADCDNTAARAQPLTRQAVVADLVASRQAPSTLSPRDGEWYNVPAPLGHMAGMDHMARHGDRGTSTSGAAAGSPDRGTGMVACLSTPMR